MFIFCTGVDDIDMNVLNQERATAIEKKEKEDEEDGNENEEMTDFGDDNEDEDEEGGGGSIEYQSIDGDDDSRE